MKLQRKGSQYSHRGVIGVESAIVMIAFVIVAAALAFVVLNMGFQTSQKAKTTIIAGLEESSSSMQIVGKVTGVGCTLAAKGCSTPYLNATAFPIKVSSGGDAVDLGVTTTAVKYITNSIQYDDIYAGPITAAEYRSLSLAFTQATAETGSDFDAFNGDVHPISGTVPSSTSAFIYWSVQQSANQVLDQGEHAVLAIGYASSERPTALDTIRAEIIPATGASLSVERQVPTITTQVVDLG
ncbi:archaellin/type IV pilin N-terminal domain-containing protein [Nitrosopumilus adriaticus]|uniref:archaellin/type IV pilin N-terminal domain-containing protein n=1 Tax=Nitrosopumilus adriaticus TaxID=1580092 RepID=UPI00352C630F